MPDDPQELIAGVIIQVHAVRHDKTLEPTGFVVRLNDGREVLADADPRPAKRLRRKSFLISSSVEVVIEPGAELARIVTFSRGL